MVQIVKRKKKGRPSKADLARRLSGSPATEPVVRRSHRQRNVRYNIDYDDYLDDDYDDEEEDERLQKKLKLKLVVKLNQGGEGAEPELTKARTELRGAHALDDVESPSEEDESERNPLKKRRIGRVNEDEEEDDDDENRADAEDEDEDILGVRRRTKVGSKGSESVSGTPPHIQSGIPLPDKKTLELILDKLQKKDIYGVYAEPVDPEELPDYHDVIEHPMDFATVRKNLAAGAYSTLEHFATDVFLICSNAMLYNAPETIYYKQAHTIQELAKKKFERLRVDYESSEKELKLEQKTKSNCLVKKQIKKLPGRISQEPMGSDFSSGATLATAGDIQNSSYPAQGGGYEKNSNIDGHVEGNSSLFENNLEKAEELFSGKSFSSRLGRKAVLLDENRRATYNISNQPEVRSESILTTFEGEMKQLVAVGLHAEYSYARSLARFAATLGPVAWKVASKRIEQALPAGCKFGLGWVGEYEPLPTPVLLFENRNPKESGLCTPVCSAAELRKNEILSKIPFPTEENRTNGPVSEVKQSLLDPVRRDISDGKPSLFGSGGIKHSLPLNSTYQQQNLQHQQPNNFTKPSKIKNQFELNLLPSPNQNHADPVPEKQSNSQSIASRSKDSAPVKMSLLPSGSFKLPDSNGVVAGGLPNGKVVTDCLNSHPVIVSSGGLPDQIARVAAYSSHGQEQGLTDPVQLMKSLSEKAQRQQKYISQGPIEAPPVLTVESNSIRKTESNNASMTAARAWMSVGAGGFKKIAENSSLPNNHILADSLYNPARDFNPQITRVHGEPPCTGGNKFHSERNGNPLQACLPQSVRKGMESQLQSQPKVFPQLAQADLSRFQVHPHWQGLRPHAQPRQKQEMLPPDLNIGFQSPSSPVRHSSGVQVDSQQPDLALQL